MSPREGGVTSTRNGARQRRGNGPCPRRRGSGARQPPPASRAAVGSRAFVEVDDPTAAVCDLAHRRSASPDVPPIRVLHTEPYGSVPTRTPLDALVRRALRRHPTWRSGATRACRRFDHGPCREIPNDPHGHEEACWRLGAGGVDTTEKVGRVRTCNLGPRRLEEEAASIERYRQLWDARFDELDKVVEELKRKEKVEWTQERE